MRLLPLIIITALSCNYTHAQHVFTPGTRLCDTGEWQLSWHDEFDGNVLDKSKWMTWFPVWNPHANALDTYASSIEARQGAGVLYLDKNVEVRNGICRLAAIQEQAEWPSLHIGNGLPDTLRKNNTGGMIHTYFGSFNKGRFEMRCRFPKAAEDVHATFWIWGNQNRNEIDFLEWYGTRREVTSVIHRWYDTGQVGEGIAYPMNAKGWHIFTTDWDENFIRFYLDDELKYTQSRWLGPYGNIGDCTPLPYHVYRPNLAALDNNETAEIVVSLDADRARSLPPGAKRTWEIDYIRVYKRRTP